MTLTPEELLGEDDYREAMRTRVQPWLQDCVQAEDITGFDGTRLRCYHAAPEQAKGLVVMVHGFCEFFGKYHETAWNLYRAGYAFLFPELRGHGDSGGKTAEPDVVYIDSFDTYVKDLRVCLDAFASGPYDKRILFGHSMGGCVAALLLEQGGGFFDAALLASPMFYVKRLSFSLPVRAGLWAYVTIGKRGKARSGGAERFNPDARFEDSSAKSRARFDYIMDQRRADARYRMFGASYGWALAASGAIRRVIRDADRIDVPVTLFTAGDDRMVDAEGFARFVQRAPHVTRIDYGASGHEIFNAADAERKRFFMDLFRVLGEVPAKGR